MTAISRRWLDGTYPPAPRACILVRIGEMAAMDDGIYVLLKNLLDNSIDEYMMGCKTIEVTVEEETISVSGTMAAVFLWEKWSTFPVR